MPDWKASSEAQSSLAIRLDFDGEPLRRQIEALSPSELQRFHDECEAGSVTLDMVLARREGDRYVVCPRLKGAGPAEALLAACHVMMGRRAPAGI